MYEPIGQAASGWTSRAEGTKELRRQYFIQGRLLLSSFTWQCKSKAVKISHTATKTWSERVRGRRAAIVSLAQFPVTAYHLLLPLHPLVFCWTGQWPALFRGGLHAGKNTKSSPVTHLSHNEPKLFWRSIKSTRWESPEGWGSHLLFRGCWHRHTDGQRWGICSLQQAGLRASRRMLNKDINNEMSL